MNEKTGTGFHIRAGRPEDAAGIASLHVRAHEAAYAGSRLSRWPTYEERLEMWSGLLGDDERQERAWVAVQPGDGRVSGFALGGPCGDADVPAEAGEIYALYVEPTLTGRGIGSALLARATDELRASGYAPLFIWALESNEQARAFYGKKGWWQDRGRKLSGEETVIRCRLLQTGRETE